MMSHFMMTEIKVIGSNMKLIKMEKSHCDGRAGAQHLLQRGQGA
jgi:hypothetical protein